jgi:hypothetical protein
MSDNKEPYAIINIFEVSPEILKLSIEEREKAVDEIFTYQYVHIEEDDGKYYIARVATVNQSIIGQVTKLAPTNDVAKQLYAALQPSKN